MYKKKTNTNTSTSTSTSTNVEVNLIDHPLDLLDIIYTACKTCYSKDTPVEIYNNTNNVNSTIKLNLIKKVIASGHHSTLEHNSFTFTVSGINRATSHQIVRHRIGNAYSQKSQRYVTYDKPFEYSVPKSIDGDKVYYCETLGDDLKSLHDFLSL